ncbi:MAG: Sec-independent protein translocase protein TatB [Woeseiaceae bacterium]
MSGFSSPEFLLIVVLALVVLGPKRLPEIANKVGGWVGQARRMTRIMKRQLEEELNVDDLNQIASPETAFKSSPVTKKAKAASDAEADAVAEADEAVDDEPAELDAPRPDHIPNDDDTYSALHAEEDEQEKSA